MTEIELAKEGMGLHEMTTNDKMDALFTAMQMLGKAEAEIERLRDLLDKLPAELRCLAMDYGIAGNIEGVDVANYCADHIDAARAALEGTHATDK